MYVTCKKSIQGWYWWQAATNGERQGRAWGHIVGMHRGSGRCTKRHNVTRGRRQGGVGGRSVGEQGYAGMRSFSRCYARRPSWSRALSQSWSKTCKKQSNSVLTACQNRANA